MFVGVMNENDILLYIYVHTKSHGLNNHFRFSNTMAIVYCIRWHCEIKSNLEAAQLNIESIFWAQSFGANLGRDSNFYGIKTLFSCSE